ncbi:MAG: STAS domain-containing protein [Candidatus Riflebacteria bacterium]|nr:STAS domain-containing protein [Candidatus Riflebacteria bacterium]
MERLYEISKEEGKTIVKLSENINASNITHLRSAIQPLLAESAKEIVFDLERVKIFDSNGIDLLVSTGNLMKKSGGRVSVIGASEDIKSVFRILKLEKRFTNQLSA